MNPAGLRVVLDATVPVVLDVTLPTEHATALVEGFRDGMGRG